MEYLSYCPSCAKLIIVYKAFFDLAASALMAEKLNMDDVDPKKFIFANMTEMPPTQEIFEALNIDNFCCRSRILTGIDSKDIYNK